MIKKILLRGLLAFVGLAGLSLFMLLVSAEGVRLSIRTADRFLSGQLSVDSVKGCLVDRFVLQGLRYVDGPDVVSFERIEFSWHPLSLLRKEFDISSLEIKGADFASSTQNDDDESFSLPPFALPLSITIRDGGVEGLAVKTAADAPEVRITSIRVNNLSGAGSLIRIGTCEVASDLFRVAVKGQLQTGEVYFTRLDVDYKVNADSPDPITGTGEVNGSLDQLTYQAHFRSPFVGTSTGVVNDLTGELSWKGSITAEQVILSHLVNEWPEVTLTGLQTSGHGTLSSYSLQAIANVTYESYQDLRVSLQVSSTDSGTQSVDSSMNGLAYEADFLSPFTGSVKGVVNDLSGEVNWRASITADQLTLSQLHQDWPDLSFTGLQATGTGTQSSYSLQATTTAAYDSFHDIAVSATIEGDGNGLRVTDGQLRHVEAVLNTRGQIGWENMLNWQATLAGSQIDPVLLDQRWPGSLNFEALTSGQFNNEKLAADVNLRQLAGQLRGFPVTASGKVSVAGSNYILEALSIRSSDSLLQASGRVADSVAIDFKLHSKDLKSLWPDLSGSIDTSGRISGSRQQPEFYFELSGDSLALGKTTIAEVLTSGTGVLTEDGSINASLTAKEVSIAGTPLDTVAVDLKGTLQDHVFEAGFHAPRASTTVTLAGGYAEEKWSGSLDKCTVQTNFIDNWQLHQPVPITLSLTDIAVGNFCLTGVQSSQVCAEGKYELAGPWNAQAAVTSLPLDMFGDMQEQSRKIGGLLSGTAHLKGRGAEIVEGEIDVSADNLSAELNFSDKGNRVIEWRKNDLHATLAGSTAEVKINSVLEDGSFVTADAVLNDIDMVPFSLGNAGIKGNLHFDIKDLQPLTAISYPAVEPSGTLKGNLDFSGPPAQPDFLGYAQLEQGKMILPGLGITVKDVGMKFDGKGNRLHLEVTATSGKGRVKGEGVYSFGEEENAPPVEFVITGKDFQIVNLPDSRINISPELKMKISKKHGELKGKILIPEAYYFSRKLEGSVSPSKDIVFVDDQTKSDEAQWPLFTDITLVAGEDVRINAFGLRGRVAGQLQIVDQPAKTATGEGGLDIREGTFSIYGRQLKIVRGRLLYSGNQLDNPGIDVRAENTAGGVTTGIQVAGFLQEPDISFYSTPPMEQDEIISRLLMNTSLVGSSEDKGFLGSVASNAGMSPLIKTVQDVKQSLHVDDIKFETGKTSEDISLVIGTWLTPKLYISYGQNLLNESVSFNTRYVLGHGFSMETESGETQSGVDLKYEIDK